MYLEQKIRQEFAESIISAAGLGGTEKGKIFIGKFSGLGGLKNLNASKFWIEKVIYWITYEHKSQMASLINQNYNNPQEVLDYIIEHKKPI